MLREIAHGRIRIWWDKWGIVPFENIFVVNYQDLMRVWSSKCPRKLRFRIWSWEWTALFWEYRVSIPLLQQVVGCKTSLKVDQDGERDDHTNVAWWFGATPSRSDERKLVSTAEEADQGSYFNDIDDLSLLITRLNIPFLSGYHRFGKAPVSWSPLSCLRVHIASCLIVVSQFEINIVKFLAIWSFNIARNLSISTSNQTLYAAFSHPLNKHEMHA